MVLDWRWRMCWTSTCPLDHEAWWWVSDDLGMHGGFWARSMGQNWRYDDRHLYKFIVENFLWSTIQIYNRDPSTLVFQYDNDPKHTSKIVQECSASQPFQLLQWYTQSPDLYPIEYFGHFSDGAWTNLQHLQEVSKNCGRVCVQCIPISVNKIAWRFMRACHKELRLCWRVGVTWPITQEFVCNLNKVENLYIVSKFALHHTFLLSM